MQIIILLNFLMVVHQNHVNERFHNGISVTEFAEGILLPSACNISTSEKDKVSEFLWMKHCDEMQLIEGNVLVINGVVSGFQFYQAADVLHVMK